MMSSVCLLDGFIGRAICSMIYSIQCALSKHGQGAGGANQSLHMHNVVKQNPVAAADQTGLIAPDTTGMNFSRADPALSDLLRIPLSDDLFRHIEPHLDRLGA